MKFLVFTALLIQMALPQRDAISELKHISSIYGAQGNLYMQVRYRLYDNKNSTSPSETMITETYKMGTDKSIYKGKGWEYIQNGELVLRIDHDAKVLHILQTKLVDAPTQDPLSAFKDLAASCPTIKQLPDVEGKAGIFFNCPSTGYKEAELRYDPATYRIQQIKMVAEPGQALGEEGGYLKLDILKQAPLTNKGVFTFSKYLKKTKEGYEPVPAYAHYRFIDQSLLFKKN